MSEQTYFRALTIAGFDGSGGAGIQADLKTFSALGCYGMTVLTALPVQNTTGVQSIYSISAICVEEQMRSILSDIGADVIKIGMLHRPEIIESVVKVLSEYPSQKIVTDPVMVAKSGDKLLTDESITMYKEKLLPLCTVLTPNLYEAMELLSRKISTKSEMEQAAKDLVKMGPQAVIVKGGHLEGNDCGDCLYLKNADNHEEIHWFSSPRIDTINNHGTGCTFSAAIAAFMAKNLCVVDAVREAKIYLTDSLAAGAQYKIGHGHGPVHHFHSLWPSFTQTCGY